MERRKLCWTLSFLLLLTLGSRKTKADQQHTYPYQNYLEDEGVSLKDNHSEKKKTTAKIKSQFFFNRFNNVYIFLAPEYDGGVGGYVLRRGETFYPSYHPYYYDLGDGFTRQLDGDGSVINNALVVGGLAALGLGIGEAVVYNQVKIKWMWCCCCCRRRRHCLRSCCYCLW